MPGRPAIQNIYAGPYLDRSSRLRDGELEDARWFSRADLLSGRMLLPPRQSISYRLIQDWLA